MSLEITVALIGAGGAVAGALAGGAAAVAAATKAARSTYLGPLRVAQRTAQQSAYAQLLNAANEFEATARGVRGEAYALVGDVGNEAEGIPRELSASEADAARAKVQQALDYGKVRAAVRLVVLAGPDAVSVAASGVERAAQALAGHLRDLEDRIDQGPGSFRPLLTFIDVRNAYEKFSDTLTRFAVTARKSGGHGGDVVQ